tara:strand:- start:234 stop:482 length:249 start_codon:yes stop_codon:yes gene_type:complete
MLENKLLISFLIGLAISLVYYYINSNSEEEIEEENKIGIYITVFIFSLVISYLVQIGYVTNKKTGGSVEPVIDGGQSYKAPF